LKLTSKNPNKTILVDIRIPRLFTPDVLIAHDYFRLTIHFLGGIMRNISAIVVVFFAATSVVFSGCGQSRPVAVADPDAGKKSGKRSSTTSSSTAGSTERGRTAERTADSTLRLFSPIRTDLPNSGIEQQTTPGGTKHTRISGLSALPRAREHVYATDTLLGGNEFQQMWIEVYGLLLMTVKLLDEMRSNLEWRTNNLAEARKHHDLVPEGLQTLTEAGIEKFNEFYEQWRHLHKLAHGLSLRFYLGTKELSAEPFFRMHQLQAPLLLTIKLACPSCPKQHPWDGAKRKLPFCCRQSLLVRAIQDLASQESFDFDEALGRLLLIQTGTQTMHTKLVKYLEKLRPATRNIHPANAFLITLPKLS